MSSPKKNKTEKRLETLAKKSAELKETLLVQLTKYPIVQVACEKSGVGRSTYYLWRNEDKEFAKLADKALDAGTGFINDLAESKLINNIQDGDNTAIIYWLKNHHVNYNDRIRHEHEHTLELLDEDKQAIAKALINIGLGNILKNYNIDPVEWEERQAREIEEHRRRVNGEPEPAVKEEKTVKYTPPKKVEVTPPPEKPYIRMKDRKGANINDILRKRGRPDAL